MTDKSIFETLGKPIERKKGDLLLRQGETDQSIFVLIDGLLKAYYTTMDGKELIKSFIQAGDFIGSLIACHTGEPSTFNLMCLEDSLLRRIPFEELKNGVAEHPEVAGNIINSLIELSIKKERREYEFLCLSATDRYTLLQQRSPGLIDRVTQNDIASYLGITPVALSRIKNAAKLG